MYAKQAKQFFPEQLVYCTAKTTLGIKHQFLNRFVDFNEVW
jgi:hypothetical protein